MELPKKGKTRSELQTLMRELRANDVSWREGRTFSLVYHAGDEVNDVIKDAYTTFFAENALSPLAFPSLRRMETEVVSFAASLFHGEGAAGSLTSGGTESILLAVKTARDFARAMRPHVTRPNMVVPNTIHPAFQKAAHYLDVRIVNVPHGPDYRADVAAMAAAIDDDTILLVGSAPPYPQGVVDPIEALASLAQSRGLLFHVDACLGGFMLPWVEKLGREVPAWDFRVPGVTSMSADLHKYGYAGKGASVVLYRERALRRLQFMGYGDWPGGLWASPTMLGTRAGGPIAAAWAVMNHLGEEGYLELARRTLEATDRFRAAVEGIPGLRVLGAPHMSVFAFASDTLNVYELADAMEARGWHLDRQQMPPACHVMITPAHLPVADRFAEDLRECASRLQSGEPAPEGSAAMYGMMGAMPDRGAVKDFILEFLDGFDRPA